MRIHIYYLASLLFASPVVQAAKVRLQLEGLTGELQKHISTSLSILSTNKVINDSHLQAKITEIIRVNLRIFGYYEPQIIFNTNKSIPNSSSILVIKVLVGEPIKIGGSNIVIEGSAKNDLSYQAWVEQGRPKIGSQLNHGTYEKFKNGFSNLALRNGYFDGEFKHSQLKISIEQHKAFWDINYNSGLRYQFDKVSFQGSQINADYLQNLVPFKKGDPYSSRDLTELNRRLSATGWFNSVVISPQFNKNRLTKVVLLNAMLSPRVKNIIETGIGYSTDVGPRLKGTWKKPWINHTGNSFTAHAYIASPEQQLDASYKIPLFKNPLEQYYTFSSSLKRTSINSTKSDTTIFAISRSWNNSKSWEKSINLHWSLDHFTQGKSIHTTKLLYPGIGLYRTHDSGGLMPKWGNLQRYWIDVSNTIWGSDINFIIVRAQNVWIHQLGEKHRFIMRNNLGWIKTNDFYHVPPNLRFFVGGDRNIRGYKYKSLSVEDTDGNLIGALKMVTGSLEYEYNLGNKWWSAVFIDSGEAINNIKHSNFKTGIGFGLRWLSPIGPIKFDLAYPIGNDNEHGMQFYIGVGPEL